MGIIFKEDLNPHIPIGLRTDRYIGNTFQATLENYTGKLGLSRTNPDHGIDIYYRHINVASMQRNGAEHTGYLSIWKPNVELIIPNPRIEQVTGLVREVISIASAWHELYILDRSNFAQMALITPEQAYSIVCSELIDGFSSQTDGLN